MDNLYDMIFKRKSMRKFDKSLLVSKEELNQIMQQIQQLISLDESIKVEFEIVKKSETSCKRGEYCLLMYSETKPNYLLNAGYMLEQMDLFLATIDIGVCWYGFGKPKEKKNTELDFVIMLNFGKNHKEDFRKDMFKSKRKSCDIIWNGDFDKEVVNLVRHAPSSVNIQPWRVISNGKSIKVYRTTKVNSIMPPNKRPYYNSIDMGIFLYFLEIILNKKNYLFKKELAIEEI
jgi:hypothetical protein